MGCCCKKRISRLSILDKDNPLLSPEEKKKIERLSYSDFTILKLLGRGSFAKVLLVKRNTNNNLYAMKVLKKDLIQLKNQEDHIKTERMLLANIKSPFIVNLYYAFQDEFKLYFITEFMQGGELFFHLHKEKQFNSEKTKFYTIEILLALEDIHNNNMIYRDLKPENILFDKYGHIKLTDFGLSKILDKKNMKTYTICGTPEYLAPEILLNKGYDKSVDFFSLGCLIYEMLSGKSPFKLPNNGILKVENYLKIPDMPDYFSECEKDIISKLLNSNPKLRLGFGENGIQNIKKHSYFNDVNWDDYRNKKINPPFVPVIKNKFDLTNFDRQFTLENVFDDEESHNGINIKVDDDEYKNFTYENREFREKLEKNEDFH